jgi:hypothetical protein
MGTPEEGFGKTTIVFRSRGLNLLGDRMAGQNGVPCRWEISDHVRGSVASSWLPAACSMPEEERVVAIFGALHEALRFCGPRYEDLRWLYW